MVDSITQRILQRKFKKKDAQRELRREVNKTQYIDLIEELIKECKIYETKVFHAR